MKVANNGQELNNSRNLNKMMRKRNDELLNQINIPE